MRNPSVLFIIYRTKYIFVIICINGIYENLNMITCQQRARVTVKYLITNHSFNFSRFHETVPVTRRNERHTKSFAVFLLCNYNIYTEVMTHQNKRYYLTY